MHLKYICYLLLFSAFLIGCSEKDMEAEGTSAMSEPVEQTEEQAEEEKEEKGEKEGQAEGTEDDLAMEPFRAEDVEEIMQLSCGKYGENNFDEIKIQEEIAAFPNELTSDNYYTKLLALMVADYRELYEQIVNFDTSYSDPNAAPDGSNSVEEGAPIGKEVNVVVLLDASGSMRGEIEGKTKMEHAVDAIQSFVSILPSDINISLQVYGNEGSSNTEDKALSCASTEIVYELSPYNEEQFSSVLAEIKPAGWTPLAASISATFDDLQANTAEASENIVYIVSDGLETCEGNPIEEAEKLNTSDYEAVINIIGFDVDDEGQKELKKIADAGSGQYMTVKSLQEIEDFFNEEKAARKRVARLAIRKYE